MPNFYLVKRFLFGIRFFKYMASMAIVAIVNITMQYYSFVNILS